MASFKDPGEVLIDYSSKTGKIWALFGSAVGLLALVYFVTRPAKDHVPAIREVSKLSFGPKTAVEAKTNILILLLSLLGGILLPILFPPKSPITDTIVGRSALVRSFVGCLTTVFAGGVMLPMSLWLLTKIILGRRL